MMNEGTALDWGICDVGVMPQDRRMKDVMAAQDCLYTLVVKAPDGTKEARVVGSIRDYLFAADDPDAVLRVLTDEETRIVTLTITEGGYPIDPVTGLLDAYSPDIAWDLASRTNFRTPFGFIAEATVLRRARGVPPLTVASCDNIQGNGVVARRSLVAFAESRDPELGAWIDNEVAFPSSMVDRITPATVDADRVELARGFGLEDRWPVVCEPFTQWVLEDSFPSRPALENVGVRMVGDVEPYELMKLPLLNASHQALCYFGYLAGYRLVHDVCRDPLFSAFLLSYMQREGAPTLGPVPGIDLDGYISELIVRFTNPEIRGTVERLCAYSSDRIPKWLLPVIHHNLAHGGGYCALDCGRRKLG